LAFSAHHSEKITPRMADDFDGAAIVTSILSGDCEMKIACRGSPSELTRQPVSGCWDHTAELKSSLEKV
jgi:hypothetical protein